MVRTNCNYHFDEFVCTVNHLRSKRYLCLLSTVLTTWHVILLGIWIICRYAFFDFPFASIWIFIFAQWICFNVIILQSVTLYFHQLCKIPGHVWHQYSELVLILRELLSFNRTFKSFNISIIFTYFSPVVQTFLLFSFQICFCLGYF